MLIQVDRTETHLIQKITDRDRVKVIRYQTVPIDQVGNYEAVENFDTLVEARQNVGLAPVAPTEAPSLAERRQAKAERAKADSDAAKAKKSRTKKAA